MKNLGPDDADALIDVMALFDFVDHGDGIVGIGNNRFVTAVQSQLFAAQDVFPRPFAIGLEVRSRADVGPFDIVVLAHSL